MSQSTSTETAFKGIMKEVENMLKEDFEEMENTTKEEIENTFKEYEEEMNRHEDWEREYEEERKADMLAQMISDAAHLVNHYADTLLKWARKNDVDKKWTYMSNKDVYYIPDIVGIMPNLKNFEASAQQCSNPSFAVPSVAEMNFGGFKGDFPTAKEAEKIYGRICKNRRLPISVRGVEHDGLTCKYHNSFVCYNTYRGGSTYRYGEGYDYDYGWNLPIYRFHGENSSAITLEKTILYWLQYGLCPKQFEIYKDVAVAFDVLKKFQNYIATGDNGLFLDVAKVKKVIRSGKEVSWMPKKATEILSGFVQALLEGKEKHIDNRLYCLFHADANDRSEVYHNEIYLNSEGHWDLWDMDDLLNLEDCQCQSDSEEEKRAVACHDEFIKGKAEAIIKYLIDKIETVEEGDITVEEVAGLLGESGMPEKIACGILNFLAEENSRLEYDDDDVYEIAKIVRKRNTAENHKDEEPRSLNEKKADAILEYLLCKCYGFEEGDFTTEEITESLEDAGNNSVDDTAKEILCHVAAENSRFRYNDDEVYEIARIIRKRFIRVEDDTAK